jgi:hypothetical protein
MNAHVSDDVPSLLTGDATRAEVLAAAAHLRSCPDCREELVSAVVAHASLSSARRFAPQIMATGPMVDESDQSGTDLPDMSAVFEKIRIEAETGKPRRRRRVLALAAAAVVVTAAGVTIAEIAGSGSPPADSQVVALAPFGVGTKPARATVLGDGSMRIDASSLPEPGRQHRYEVWLTNSQRSQMQPIGWIGNDGKATLTIPADLMSQYQDIEVSVQDVGADSYDYSGTSVLRGNYG